MVVCQRRTTLKMENRLLDAVGSLFLFIFYYFGDFQFAVEVERCLVPVYDYPFNHRPEYLSIELLE